MATKKSGHKFPTSFHLLKTIWISWISFTILICFETSQVVSTSEQKICKCKCHKRRLRAYPWAIMAPCPSLPWNAPGWLRNCAELWPSFSILFPAIIHCGPMWTTCFLALTFCFQPNCYVCRAALACVLCQFQILLAGNWDELSWVNFVSGLPWVAQSGRNLRLLVLLLGWQSRSPLSFARLGPRFRMGRAVFSRGSPWFQGHCWGWELFHSTCDRGLFLQLKAPFLPEVWHFHEFPVESAYVGLLAYALSWKRWVKTLVRKLTC